MDFTCFTSDETPVMATIPNQIIGLWKRIDVNTMQGITLDITHAILKEIIIYCEMYLKNKTSLKKKATTKYSLSEWENEFLKNKTNELIFMILPIANEYQIETLEETCCKYIAQLIRGQSTTEGIRELFGFKSDFTPEEEERIKKEYNWC